MRTFDAGLQSAQSGQTKQGTTGRTRGLQTERSFSMTQHFGQVQAPVVQKVDSAIYRINLYPLDSAIGFPNTYPLDSDLSSG